MKKLTAIVAVALLCSLVADQRLLGAAEQAKAAAQRNVTFISTSDSHYKAVEQKAHNDADRETIEQMNAIATVAWPKQLGGDAIDPPRGVMLLGDCIDDGDKKLGDRCITAEQYAALVKDFGLDGTDGLLKYRVYEGWGNHDGPPVGAERFGFSFQAHLKKRNAVRKEKGWLTGLSENGLHYSWDWDDVHFVQLGIYPADAQNPKIRYSPKWHDPQGALTFLKQDVVKCVGQSGRPVVLMSHCGFDTDWWHKDDWKAVYDAMRPYNIILYLYGHTGTGLRDWAPEGEEKRWTCVNDGNTTAGFFVIQITGDRMRLAYRCKENVKVAKNADGTTSREWDGTWGWRFSLDKKIAVPAAK
jgi:cytolysin (calcineurin-like family phosphatase)